MNDARRKLLREALTKLSEAKSLVEQARDEEQDYHDAMPESFQQGDKGEEAQAKADQLGEACEGLETAESSVEEALS